MLRTSWLFVAALLILACHIEYFKDASTTLHSRSERQLDSQFVRCVLPLVYNRDAIREAHEEVQRLKMKDVLTISFQVDSRKFSLILLPHKGLFSPTHKLRYGGRELEDVNTSHIYTGAVEGEKGSYVHLSIIDGRPQGHIRIPKENTFYLEPAALFLKEGEEVKFDTMVYTTRDIIDEKGTEKTFKIKLEQEKHSKEKRPKCQKTTPWNDGEVKHVCSLHLRAGPSLAMYFERVRFQGVISDEQVKVEVMAFLASHVAELKRIFQSALLETAKGAQIFGGLDFQIERTTIMSHKACHQPQFSPLCAPMYKGIEQLGIEATIGNQDDYCLSLLFACRGRLWPSTSWLGGLACSRFQTFRRFLVGQPFDLPMSPNTGVVNCCTLKNPIPLRMTQLSLARVVARSLNIPLDTGACLPSSSSGHDTECGDFIMTQGGGGRGNKEHHDQFSICSWRSMTENLDAMIQNKLHVPNCLRAEANETEDEDLSDYEDDL